MSVSKKGLLAVFIIQLVGCSSNPPLMDKGNLDHFSRLEPVSSSKQAYFYEKPGVHWLQYDSAIVEPISLQFRSPDPKTQEGDQVPPEQTIKPQEMARTISRYQSDVASIVSEHYTQVDTPNEGTLRFRSVVIFEDDFIILESELIDAFTMERLFAFAEQKKRTKASFWRNNTPTEDLQHALHSWSKDLQKYLKRVPNSKRIEGHKPSRLYGKKRIKL